MWLFSSTLKSGNVVDDNIVDYFNLSVKAILTICLIYILSVWMFPQLDAYIGWLISSGVIMLCAASFIIIQGRRQHSDVYRLVGQWLATGFFVCVMYFWLNAQANLLWLLSSLTLLFLVTVINGNWNFVKRLFNQKNGPSTEVLAPYNSDEMFSFTHDPATNLPSYQQALIKFEQLYKQDLKKRYAVIVIKPINFEHVNQILGHQNSDILLLQLAYCLQKQVAQNDNLITFDYSSESSRLARLQSLHFLAIVDVNNCNYPEKTLVEDVCRQLADAVPEAMSFKSFSLNFELACGIAFTGEHGSAIQEVIAHAGDALLIAEKNQTLFHYYDKQGSLYTEQQLLKMERLKQDIADDSLEWIVHPIVELSSKELKGFSLDVRWRHFGDEYLAFRDFLALAENSGELYTLSKHMVKHAFKLLFELKKINVFQPIAISLSSTELLEPDLVDYIEEQIKKFNIAGKYLMIEMTEPVMVMACERAKSMIDQLRMLEVQISIDDFTGSYESLRYIRKLSIDQVKVSCEQLTISEENTAEKAIVNSLVNLARTMKLPFVGSHINSKEMQSVFEAMGGKVIQGTILGTGVPMIELSEWIVQWYKRYPQATTNKPSLDI